MACEPPGLVAFADGAQMDVLLAGLIADRLALALAQKGKASLAVSGGSSPRGLYQRLSRTPLDWARVHVVLVDERMVPPSDAASNERLVRESLLQHDAAAARFRGMYAADQSLQAAAQACADHVRQMPLPFDVLILGMGVDGHTASWFPRAEGLDAALDQAGDALCAPVLAPAQSVAGTHRQRLTLTRRALAGAQLGVLVLRGAAKRAAYEKARAPGAVQEMPVRAILRTPPHVFWPCWAP